MSRERIPPPARPARGAARGAQAQAPSLRRQVSETRRVGDTDEVMVEQEEGQTSIPVETEDYPVAQRPSRRLSGIRISDVVGREDLEEATKGIGPKIVILHDGVTGPGTRGLGPLTRGKVVPLSALLGVRLTEALLDEDFGPEDVKERDYPRRARALVAHYLGPISADTGKPEDPAFREARLDEEDMTLVTFAENEGELEEALDDREEALVRAQSDNEVMRDIIQRMARNEEVSDEELAQFTGFATDAGIGATAGPPVEPKDPLPKRTGDENPRQRDPSFIQQRPHDRRPSVESTAGAGGNVTPTETVGDEGTLDDVFNPEVEEDGGGATT